jgi:hypothetical protein
MAQAARDRAVDTFDIDRVVPLYEDYYRQVQERTSLVEA